MSNFLKDVEPTVKVTIDTPTKVINIKSPKTVALDRGNYFAWRTQFLGAMRGNGLSPYLDGKIALDSSVTVQQDQLILGWILSSLTASVVSEVSHCETAAECWETLQEEFASSSRSQVLNIQQKLQNLKKGGKSFTEYISEINQLLEGLSVAGKKMEDSDLVLLILAGLDDEYEALIQNVTSRREDVTYRELKAMFMDIEIRKGRSKANNPLSANVVEAEKNTKQGRINYKVIPCQICSQKGHGALNCYNRLNITKFPPTHNRTLSSDGLAGKMSANLAIKESSGSVWYPETGTIDEMTANMVVLKSVDEVIRQDRKQMSAMAVETEVWYVDSGATNHVTRAQENIQEGMECDRSINTADGRPMKITQYGNSTLSIDNRKFNMNQLLFVPSASKNLISVKRFCIDNEVSMEFDPQRVIVKDLKTKEVLIRGPTGDGLYELPICMKNKGMQANQVEMGMKATARTWHLRLGHLHSRAVEDLNRNKMIVVSDVKTIHKSCKNCCITKSKKLKHSIRSTVYNHPLELVFADIWGPAPIDSSEGYRYYINFVDASTSYNWMFLMKRKSEAEDCFMQFQKLVERQYEYKIKAVQSDNAKEFLKLSTYLRNNGIVHRLSCPHTHPQMGKVERRHRHIVDTGLAMLNHAGLEEHFWDYAFMTALHLYNRNPTKVLGGISPYEAMHHKTPEYFKLKVFGSICYPNMRPYRENKLGDKSVKCVFLGYPVNCEGYICMNMKDGRTVISRDVVFVENNFLSKKNRAEEVSEQSSDDESEQEDIAPASASGTASESTSPVLQTYARKKNEAETVTVPQSAGLTEHPLEADFEQQELTDNLAIDDKASENSESSSDEEYQPHKSVKEVETGHGPVTRAETKRRNAKYVLSITPTKKQVPKSVKLALQDSEWRAAMQEEYDALMRNGTWELIPRSVNDNVINNIWLFKVKEKSDGTVERLKARLVANGTNQVEGRDYVETFSPVVKPKTIRIVLTIAISRGWAMQQIDISNAFLHGQLEEKIVMRQPAGFLDETRPGHVCLLKKALYGLKQASRMWFRRLKQSLSSMGFNACQSDDSLFVKNDGDIIYILVYVDDMVITGSNSAKIQEVLDALKSEFAVRLCGDLEYFLGIRVRKHVDGIFLDQQLYLVNLLNKHDFQNLKPISTPMQHSQQFYSDAEVIEKATEYRRIIGSLQYLTMSRPDISYAVNKLAQFMEKPKDIHWIMMKRVLRYLSGTQNMGIVLKKSSICNISAYSDADWASDETDRKSQTGYLIYMGQSLVMWCSQKQSTVSRSSTESEFRAITAATAELEWMANLLSEMGIKIDKPYKLWCDNLGATQLAANPVFHTKIKHAALDFNFVRERVEKKVLEVNHIPNTKQKADVLTKALRPTQFMELKVNLIDEYR